MKEVFNVLETYFHACMSPFRIQEYFKYSIPLPGKEDIRFHRPNITENILISWAFYIISCFYIFVMYLISQDSILSAQAEFNELTAGQGQNFALAILIVSLIFKTILYPIFCFVHIGIWKVILSLYSELLEIKEEQRQTIVDEIISLSYSSNLFLAIPFFGPMVQYIDELILMYSGIKIRMNASRTLSLLIVSTPYFILVFLWGLFVLSVSYLLA